MPNYLSDPLARALSDDRLRKAESRRRHHPVDADDRALSGRRPPAAGDHDGPVRDAGLCRLVTAAAAGDGDAMETLVRRYTPMVRAVAGSYRLGPADVDDVVQETWLRLLTHIGRLQEPAAIGGWLATTARREALRALQCATREVSCAEPPEPDAAPCRDIVEEVAGGERERALRAAIERLPLRPRTVLEALMSEAAEGYAAVARKLGVPVGSLGPTRARSLERLRDDERLMRVLHGADAS
jgi:RNA polymerase sigma factor (sigma-70 family)